jgi:hypothetical protein
MSSGGVTYYGADRLAATPKCEVKRSGTSAHSNNCMAVPLSGYSTSNFAGAAWTLPHGRDGLSARRMAVWYPFRKLSMCPQVYREFMRSALLNLTPILSATACHQRNYVETYSRSMERKCPRSGDGTLLCPASFPGASDPMAADGLIGINSYHLVLPHKSLREQLPTLEPTRGAGSPRTWRPVTPAMAAGLTDHVWTTDELLAYRVPVEFLDPLRTIEHLFPQWHVGHHSN